MKQFLSNLFFIMLISLSVNVHGANVWINNTTVTGVMPLSDGTVIVYFPENSDPACTNGVQFYLSVGSNGVTDVGAKNILSTALVAFSTTSPVSVYYDNSVSHCFINRLYLSKP